MKSQKLITKAVLFSAILFFSCNSKSDSKAISSSYEVDKYLEKANYAENNNIYDNALDYNDAIVGLQTKVMVEILEISEKTEVHEMRAQLAIIQEEINSSALVLNKIYFDGDNNSKFKRTAQKLFDFYERIFNNDYEKLLDLLDVVNNEDDYDIANNAFLEVNTIVSSFSSEEEVLDEEFSQAQKSFARDNRIFIDPAAHPLQEQIDNL
jgi:hypothetical protein